MGPTYFVEAGDTLGFGPEPWTGHLVFSPPTGVYDVVLEPRDEGLVLAQGSLEEEAVTPRTPLREGSWLRFRGVTSPFTEGLQARLVMDGGRRWLFANG